MENDLISRRAAIDAVIKRGANCGIDSAEVLRALPSAEPWDIVKRMLNELEQKEERLYSDYCDAAARLKAINKIAGSDQKLNQKIAGIKPLAELKEGE